MFPRKFSLAAVLGVALLGGACGNPVSEQAARGEAERKRREPGAAGEPRPSLAQTVEQGAEVKPPFAVRGDAEGLLLVWYDADGGAHSASQRGEIPEDRRAHVRVDSLDVVPEARLDPAQMYVADLRTALADGQYRVRTVSREAFELAISKAPAAEEKAQLAQGVVLYSASWCGACKQAASYLRQKQVPFVEKDIEKEPGARTEMQEKGRAQGVRTSGIPVIDVNGKLLTGFDPSRLDALLAK